MPKTLKRNAVIVFALAAVFHWSFMFAKHDPALRGVIPFGEDPYDAVGSFGVVIGMLIALVSLVRAFRPYDEHPPSPAQRVYLVRAQVAVVLVVLITLAADTVAMARHPSMWVGTVSRNELVGLLSGLTVVAITVQLLIRAPQETHPAIGFSRWPRAAIPALLAMFILVVYPEQLINGTATHLLTVVVGAVVLFAPMRPLLTTLVPYDERETRTETAPAHSRLFNAKHRWGIVLVLGALIGVFVFVAEMSEGGSAPPAGRLVFVASVFIGIAITGLLLAYAFLGKPLGLGQR